MAGRAPKYRRKTGDRSLGRFAVVAARFNEAISKKLADGAVAALEAGGVPGAQIETHWVPGSFELPQAALILAESGRYAGIVGVGVVIRGETPHFEFVAGEAARGLSSVALATGVPVSFGVITSLTEAQAWERAGGVVGHRGAEAARAALEMAAWKRDLQRGGRASRRSS
jgi:6,7-dimethyl-8-ribityllumazine synthase